MPDERLPLPQRTASGPSAPRQSLGRLTPTALPLQPQVEAALQALRELPVSWRFDLAAWAGAPAATPCADASLHAQDPGDTHLEALHRVEQCVSQALQILPADWRRDLLTWGRAPVAVPGGDAVTGRPTEAPQGPGFSVERLEALRRVTLLVAMGDGGTSLDLADLGLASLPPGLHRLTQLRSLMIASNPLGMLPDELGQCTRLETLDASRNQLRHLPGWLGRLTHLKTLMVESNRLESLPASLGQCGSLEILNLSRNLLTSLPDELGQLSRVKFLLLEGNQLLTLPASLAGCTSLKTLNVGDNRLHGLPDELADLPELRRLVVDGSRQLAALPARLDLGRVGVFSKGTPLSLLDQVLAPPRYEVAQAFRLEQVLAGLAQRWSTSLAALRSLGGEAAVTQLRQRIEVLQKTSVCGLEKVMDGASRNDDARGALASGNDLVDGWVRDGAWPTTERLRVLNTRVCQPEDAEQLVRARPWRRTRARCGNGAYVDPIALPVEMERFERWLQQARSALKPDDRLGQAGLAAQLYQRLLSIHPYEDGNGRTCRQAANWILQGFGLPPVHPSGATMAPWHAAVFPSRPDLRPASQALVEAFVASMQTTARCAEHVLGEMRTAREDHGAVGPCSVWVPPAGEDGPAPVGHRGFRLAAGR